MPLSVVQKRSLVEKCASTIREAIEKGEIVHQLPGEDHIANQLGVSRPTVRQALSILASEGYLEINKGKRTKVVKSQSTSSRNTQKIVCAINAITREVSSLDQQYVVHQIRLKLSEEGVIWEDYYERNLRSANSLLRLKQFIQSRPGACWVLLGSSRTIQKIFEESGEQTLVVGSCYSGVQLPAIDSHFLALGRHLGGLLLRYGHRRIALFQPDTLLAGDIMTLQGIEEAFSKEGARDTDIQRLSMSASRDEFKIAFERLMSRTKRPTVIVTLRSELSIVALSLAHNLGLKIPSDISLISRDNHLLLDRVYPEITHYAISYQKHVNGAIHLIHSLLNGQKLQPKTDFLIPELVQGETLSQARI